MFPGHFHKLIQKYTKGRRNISARKHNAGWIALWISHARIHLKGLISHAKTPFSRDKALGREEKSWRMGPLVAVKHDNLSVLPSPSPKQLKGLSTGGIRLYMVFLYAFPNHLQLTVTWRQGTGLNGLLVWLYVAIFIFLWSSREKTL